MELGHVRQELKSALSKGKDRDKFGLNYVELTAISDNVILGATGDKNWKSSNKFLSPESDEHERRIYQPPT